jgi:hypothetical protein
MPPLHRHSRPFPILGFPSPAASPTHPRHSQTITLVAASSAINVWDSLQCVHTRVAIQ